MKTTPLRRNFRFQMLWIGGAISGFGSSITWLAFPLLILAITGMPALAGVVGACRIATSILVSLPAGVWVDRLDRRRILIGCEYVRIVAMSCLVAGVIAYGAGVSPALLLAVAVVCGAADAFFRPAHATAIRGVVPEKQLPSAYAQEEARGHAASLLGPPAGGVLYGFGRVFPFVADLISYVVSLVCILLARVPRRPSAEPAAELEPKEQRRMRSEMADAMRWVWQHRGIRAALAFSVLINLVVNAELIPVITLVSERGGSSAVTGTVLAGAGVGGLVGALLSAQIGRVLPAGQLMVAVSLVLGAALCAMTLPAGTYWPAAMLFVAMVAVPALNVVLKVMVANQVPDDMMGRVSSLLEMVSMGLAPLSPMLGGVLAQLIGGAGALLALGLFVSACAVLFLGSPALRSLGTETQDAPGRAAERSAVT